MVLRLRKIKKYGKIKRFGIKSNCIKDGGEIGIVLTKSISRFARNTVDLLSTVRHLKEIGVEVRFEKERIHSFSGDGELMLSILASFAQEESRSISENSKWGIRKRYQSGEIGVKNKRVFGYSYDGENYEVVPEPVKPPKPDKPVRKRPKNIFDGKIFCGVCGRRFGRAVSQTADGGHLYWYCRAKSSHGVTCDSVNYPDLEIRGIFCEVMGQEAFDEGFFTETVEQMVVHKTGSIDFHLKDGTVRRYETLKLRSNRHENTSTDEFTGKIRCASCGNLYHRYCCYGKYTYWRCSGKSRVRTECGGHDFQDSDIRKVSSYLMGMEEFDGAEFEKQVKEITAFPDGSLACRFYGGEVRKWQRT